MPKERDDFHWPEYTACYAQEHTTSEQNGYAYFLQDGDFFLMNDHTIHFTVNLCRNIRQLIYQILIHRANVKTVYECGCGAGWNIRNIFKVFPDLSITGSDIAQNQIDFGREFFAQHNDILMPGLHDQLKVIDMSQPGAHSFVDHPADLVYCQAVTMHLEDGKALRFIQNMMKLSNRYVFMGENFGWQDYPDLLARAGAHEYFKIETTTSPFSDSCIWMERIKT
jgi:trans-aconitate methyltransferase